MDDDINCHVIGLKIFSNLVWKKIVLLFLSKKVDNFINYSSSLWHNQFLNMHMSYEILCNCVV